MTHDVNRWHAHPLPELRNGGDTIDAHQERVATLCHGLAAFIGHDLTQSDLIYAALHHDDPEYILGDIPAPAKAKFPALAAAYAKAELQVLADMGLTWTLTQTESDMLHLCDKLDAYLFAASRIKPAQMVQFFSHDPTAMKRIAAGLGEKAREWLDEKLQENL